MDITEEQDISLFKKKLKKMKAFKGKGTELISLYIPENADRSSVVGQITEEMSQSSNIKSASTRKNVQGALRKISSFLKQIDFKIPKNGLAVFAGNVSEKEGVTDLELYTIAPVQELKTKLYWCDSSFHLDPLEEMIKPTDIYAVVTIDKREATIALLKGKKYDILGKFTSGVPGKERAGGQSAPRFQRLREEAEKEFFKRVSEKLNNIFAEYEDKLKGIIVAGPGITKNEFLEREALDYRLKKKVIGTLDASYTDESGIREVMQKSDELLKEADYTKERKIVIEFFEEVSKENLATYGEKETIEAIETGKAKIVLVSEAIEWIVVKLKCENCSFEEEKTVKNPLYFQASKETCSKCKSSKVEILEEVEYSEWIAEKARTTGAETRVISTETEEGNQFYKSFEGIGCILRFR